MPDPEESRPVNAGRAILVLAVAAIALAYTGISGRHRDDEKLKQWTAEQAIPSVALVSAHKGGKARDVVLPGNVEAFETASIHGQVSGYVSQWRKDIGAKVHQGDVLAVVDTPELDQRIAVAQSEFAKAKANLALAKVTAARWDSLRHTAAVSQQEADEKDSDAHAKAAEVDAAQSNIDRLKALKAFANIAAPFDGVVTARNVDVGTLVKANSNDGAALFTVADIHQMRVYVPVPQSYAAVMKDGMRATLELPEYPDRRFDATIDTTSHAIDKKSRSLLVELIADNKDGALSPGAFTRVHFEIPPDPNAMTLPADALLFRDNATEIATLGLDNRIVLKKSGSRATWGTRSKSPGGSARTSASSPIRPIRSATARRSGSWKRPGRRHGARPHCKARKSETVTPRTPRPWRKQGRTTRNEVAAVARGVDRASARRVRLRATLRCALSRSALQVQG